MRTSEKNAVHARQREAVRAGSSGTGPHQGSTLVYIIVVMTLLSALGAGVLSLSDTTAHHELTFNQRNRAVFLSEAGINYYQAKVKLVSQGVLTEADLLMLNGRTFTLGSEGSFTLSVTDLGGGTHRVVSTGSVDGGTPLEANYQMGADLVATAPAGPSPPVPGGHLQFIREGFVNLDQWNADAHTEIQAYISQQGTHQYYAAVKDPAGRIDSDNLGVYMKQHQFCLDPNAYSIFNQYNSTLTIGETIKQYWLDNGKTLNYDVQVKVGKGFQLLYGAQGITFRYREVGSTGLYEHYGLSVVKYHQKDASCTQQGCDLNDYIPAGLKPTGQGTRVDRWGWNTSGQDGWNNYLWMPHEKDKVLLVLWVQTVYGGAEHRRWLAWKDITGWTNYSWSAAVTGNEYGAKYAKGKQSWFDTRDTVDNFTMVVRVQEVSNPADVQVNGTDFNASKANKIQIFFGDSSEYSSYTARAPNDKYYDIRNLRQVYRPAWRYTELGERDIFNNGVLVSPGNATNGTWPAPDLDKWAVHYDYFTFVRSPTEAYWWDAKWDGVAPEAGLSEDNGTIYTSTVVTPEDAAQWDDDKSEICLHSYYDPLYYRLRYNSSWVYYYSRMSVWNTATSFDDFAMDFLDLGAAP